MKGLIFHIRKCKNLGVQRKIILFSIIILILLLKQQRIDEVSKEEDRMSILLVPMMGKIDVPIAQAAGVGSNGHGQGDFYGDLF